MNNNCWAITHITPYLILQQSTQEHKTKKKQNVYHNHFPLHSPSLKLIIVRVNKTVCD